MNPIDNSVFDIMARATPLLIVRKLKVQWLTGWQSIMMEIHVVEELKASLKSLAHILLYE